MTNELKAAEADPDHRHYEDALDSLKHTIESYEGCTKEEKSALAEEIERLREMELKLTGGRVDIVLFGEISKGKSSIINALIGRPVARVDVRGGTTLSAGDWSWDSCSYRVPGLAASEVVLVDTPGLNEVKGEERARLAREAAERADLILFVVDSDLNGNEMAALMELVQTRKPIFLVVNKMDRYSRKDRERLLEIIREERRPRQIAPENVIPISADPAERERVTVSADGSERTEFVKPDPDVELLRERILAVLESEGKALLVLNAAMFAADRSDRLASIRIGLRNARVNEMIMRFAVVKGTAVAANPVPIADLLGGTVCDVSMVYQMARVYGYKMTWAKAGELAGSIAASVASIVAAEYLTNLAVSIFKGLTFGLSTAITALPQGGVAAFGTFIVGQATKVYFENNASWGEGGPKPVVRNLLDTVDKKSVLNQLKDEIRKTLDRNKYGRGRRAQS